MSAETIGALVTDRALDFSDPNASGRVVASITRALNKFDALDGAAGIALYALMSGLSAKETRPTEIPLRATQDLRGIAALLREAAQAFEEAAQ